MAISSVPGIIEANMVYVLLSGSNYCASFIYEHAATRDPLIPWLETGLPLMLHDCGTDWKVIAERLTAQFVGYQTKRLSQLR